MNRAITSDDLERYLTNYAHGVTVERIPAAVGRPIHAVAYHTEPSSVPRTAIGNSTLKSAPFSTLLKGLTWAYPFDFEQVIGGTYAQVAYPFVSLFLAESVMPLNFQFCTYRHPHVSTIMSTLRRSPALIALDLETEGEEEVLDTVVQSRLWAQESLRALRVSSTLTTSIPPLASIPQLTSLRVQRLVSPMPAPTPLPSPQAGFPRPKDLSIWSSSEDDCILLHLAHETKNQRG